MARNILNRVIQAAIVMLGVALLIFIMLRIVPGNAIVTMMGEHAKLETIERMTRELGLDQPIYGVTYPMLCAVTSARATPSTAV